MRLPPPDFVIAGAAKCGTTAVYATLQRHPELFLPRLKEPHYFAFDFPGLREVETIENYDRLFASAKRTQLRGEASVSYLISDEATGAILRRRPDAKFIVVARNPIDMFVSWHNQMASIYEEEEVDPERAWMLQEERAQGRKVPKLCRAPALLQYKTLCSLGAQIESLFGQVPETQRLVIVFDDLRQHARQVYRHIVEFLGIEDDGTEHFVRENVFARPRNELIARAIRVAYASSGRKKLLIRLNLIFDRPGIRPIRSFLRRGLKTTAKPALSREFRRELEVVFASDVQLLSRLLCRDLCELWSISDAGAKSDTGPGGLVARP